MKLVPYTNIVESVQKEVKQAKLDYKAGLIDIKTLQYVARKLDNVRDTAAFNAVPAVPEYCKDCGKHWTDATAHANLCVAEMLRQDTKQAPAVPAVPAEWRECDARLAAEQALSGKNPDSDCHGR